MLDAGENGGLDPLALQPGLDLFVHRGHEAFQVGHAGVQIVGDLLVAGGIQIAQGQILQFPLGLLHAQPVRDGGVDLHGLQRLGALLVRRLIVHGAHVVETVCDLDEDHADVLGHGHEHLAQVLHLLVFLAGVLHPGELGDALHDIRHGGTEGMGYVRMGEGGVLNDVVQQGGADGVFIQAQVHGDVRRGHAVGHVRRAVLAQLAFMGALCHVIGGTDPTQVHGMTCVTDLLLQIGIELVRIQRSMHFFGRFVHAVLPKKKKFS